jgi:hypothetical protein
LADFIADGVGQFMEEEAVPKSASTAGDFTNRELLVKLQSVAG